MTNIDTLREIFDVDSLMFCQNYIAEADAELDAARKEIARLREENEKMLSAMNETAIEVMEQRNTHIPENITAKVGHPAFMFFASEMVRAFIDSGATNYLEFAFEGKEYGDYTLTIQKVDHKTPADVIKELGAEIVQLREDLRLVNEDAEALFDWANSEGLHNWRCDHALKTDTAACTCGLADALNAHLKRTNDEH